MNSTPWSAADSLLAWLESSAVLLLTLLSALAAMKNSSLSRVNQDVASEAIQISVSALLSGFHHQFPLDQSRRTAHDKRITALIWWWWRRRFYLPPEHVVVAEVVELFSDVSSQMPIFRSFIFISGFNKAASRDLKKKKKILCKRRKKRRHLTHCIQIKPFLRLYFNMFTSINK